MDFQKHANPPKLINLKDVQMAWVGAVLPKSEGKPLFAMEFVLEQIRENISTLINFLIEDQYAAIPALTTKLLYAAAYKEEESYFDDAVLIDANDPFLSTMEASLGHLTYMYCGGELEENVEAFRQRTNLVRQNVPFNPNTAIHQVPRDIKPYAGVFEAKRTSGPQNNGAGPAPN